MDNEITEPAAAPEMPAASQETLLADISDNVRDIKNTLTPPATPESTSGFVRLREPAPDPMP